MQQNNS